MGCVSSKLFPKDHDFPFAGDGGCATTHVVSLTSSTYGVLKLDKDSQPPPPPQCIKECVVEVKKPSPARENPAEVINAWELMEGLDETEMPAAKKSPKARSFLDHRRSPLKFLNQLASPGKLRRSAGKENKPRRAEFSPKTIPKAYNLQESPWRVSPRADSMAVCSRRSLNPLFNPDLGDKLSSEEEEQIKKMISSTPISRKSRKSQEAIDKILEKFDKKCPPAGENSVVIYTTTLRGIRKTFEDCNTARSILESHHVRTLERDVSMHSGFKEELRGLMGTMVVKVPLVFVKGRMIGGADEVVKLEEEGKLGILLSGIPEAGAGCDGCAGVRFVLCPNCNGSCKVLGEDLKNTVKCGECNENDAVELVSPAALTCCLMQKWLHREPESMDPGKASNELICISSSSCKFNSVHVNTSHSIPISNVLGYGPREERLEIIRTPHQPPSHKSSMISRFDFDILSISGYLTLAEISWSRTHIQEGINSVCNIRGLSSDPIRNISRCYRALTLKESQFPLQNLSEHENSNLTRGAQGGRPKKRLLEVISDESNRKQSPQYEAPFFQLHGVCWAHQSCELSDCRDEFGETVNGDGTAEPSGEDGLPL
nr:glutaredoxin domain-containing cysteine-rich protein 1 [Ipomoea batatas]